MRSFSLVCLLLNVWIVTSWAKPNGIWKQILEDSGATLDSDSSSSTNSGYPDQPEQSSSAHEFDLFGFLKDKEEQSGSPQPQNSQGNFYTPDGRPTNPWTSWLQADSGLEEDTPDENLKDYNLKVGSICRWKVISSANSESLCDIEGASRICIWDPNYVSQGVKGACLCRRTLEECQDEESCVWYRDPENNHNALCVSNAEKLYDTLQKLYLRKRKTNFGIQISQSFLPHGDVLSINTQAELAKQYNYPQYGSPYGYMPGYNDYQLHAPMYGDYGTPYGSQSYGYGSYGNGLDGYGSYGNGLDGYGSYGNGLDGYGSYGNGLDGYGSYGNGLDGYGTYGNGLGYQSYDSYGSQSYPNPYGADLGQYGYDIYGSDYAHSSPVYEAYGSGYNTGYGSMTGYPLAYQNYGAYDPWYETPYGYQDYGFAGWDYPSSYRPHQSYGSSNYGSASYSPYAQQHWNYQPAFGPYNQVPYPPNGAYGHDQYQEQYESGNSRQDQSSEDSYNQNADSSESSGSGSSGQSVYQAQEKNVYSQEHQYHYPQQQYGQQYQNNYGHYDGPLKQFGFGGHSYSDVGPFGPKTGIYWGPGHESFKYNDDGSFSYEYQKQASVSKSAFNSYPSSGPYDQKSGSYGGQDKYGQGQQAGYEENQNSNYGYGQDQSNRYWQNTPYNYRFK